MSTGSYRRPLAAAILLLTMGVACHDETQLGPDPSMQAAKDCPVSPRECPRCRATVTSQNQLQM